MATTKPVLRDGLVVVASEMSSSSAVTFCWSEHGLPLESLSSTRTCVGWLAVAECRPGPLTLHEYCIIMIGAERKGEKEGDQARGRMGKMGRRWIIEVHMYNIE